MMKLRHFLTAGTLAATCWAIPAASVQAATLYNTTNLVQGQESFVQSFNVTSPGTLTVTLTQIPWLDTVSGLTSFTSTSAGVLGSSTGAGTENIDITGAGTIYEHWFGTAAGTYNIGAVGIDVTFQPSSVAAVALPTSFIMLLSGLGILFGWQSRRAPAAVSA
jgi:hypothetical protein